MSSVENVVSGFFLYFFMNEKDNSSIRFFFIPVSHPEDKFDMEPVHEVDLNLSNHRDNKLRFFIYQHNRYVWLSDHGVFINVQTLNEKMTINLLMENTCGINKRQQNEL